MRLVTVFCPLTTTGPVEMEIHAAGERRFVVDCKVNPVALVGHIKTKSVPERMVANCGMLNVPKPALKLVAVSVPARTSTPLPEPPHTARVNGELDPQPASERSE